MSKNLIGKHTKLRVNLVGSEKPTAEFKSITAVSEQGVFFQNDRGTGKEIFIPMARIARIEYALGNTSKKKGKKLKKGKKKIKI